MNARSAISQLAPISAYMNDGWGSNFAFKIAAKLLQIEKDMVAIDSLLAL